MAARVGGVEEFTGGLGPCLGRARDEVWHSVQVWFLLPAYDPGTTRDADETDRTQ